VKANLIAGAVRLSSQSVPELKPRLAPKRGLPLLQIEVVERIAFDPDYQVFRVASSDGLVVAQIVNP
jgi:hypothetical protein